MSEIIKTEALVLNKINYGDTSMIASLYTKDYGKLSGIIKGGRSSKSKIGSAVNQLNHLEIVLYKKDTREVQLISGASIISHYPGIKDDFEKLRYALAILELLKKLTPEHETNLRLFAGTVRILSLFESSNESALVLFGRYYLFFLAEIGYGPQFNECVSCGKSNLANQNLAYNFDLGIFCNDCSRDLLYSFSISMELFEYLLCLKNNKNAEKFNKATKEKAISFFENFTRHHIPDFKGLQSIQIFN
jgi:DNA repair protein RecO (recombination protein O)